MDLNERELDTVEPWILGVGFASAICFSTIMRLALKRDVSLPETHRALAAINARVRRRSNIDDPGTVIGDIERSDEPGPLIKGFHSAAFRAM